MGVSAWPGAQEAFLFSAERRAFRRSGGGVMMLIAPAMLYAADDTRHMGENPKPALDIMPINCLQAGLRPAHLGGHQILFDSGHQCLLFC